MAKKVVAIIKLQVPAGKANPSPPVGPALGQHGLNIMEFCKAFNAKTQGQEGVVPVVITGYADRSFTFVTKTPPAADLLKRAASLAKASSTPGKGDFAGTVTKAQVREIASLKFVDMTADSIETAEKTIAGSARSMGIEVVD